MRRRVTVAVITLAAIIIATGAWLRFYGASGSSQRSLLAHLPNEPTAVLSIDFAMLRRAGLLNRTAPLEPEYKAFLEGTGFDYRRDLDLVIASFSHSGNYFIARGRFDWPKLRTYALSRGGSCYEQLCRAQGSAPERRISFLPLRRDVMALAVSSDDLAATRLTGTGEPVTAAMPNAPVWLSMPGAVFARPGALPEGIRVSLSGLLDADRIVITAGAGGRGFEAHLDARCRTVEGARTLESQLRSSTAVLKNSLRDSNAARAETLAGFLSSGSFGRDDTKVTGTWPISPSMIQSLTAGI